MYKVFIDTCAFDRMGLNFDENNATRIKSLIDHTNNDIKIILISVVKNEIISHINKKIKEDIEKINSFNNEIKWASYYLTDDVIKDNTRKRMEDFNNFLLNAKIQEEDVNDITPEIIFEKYFKIEFPFEDNKEKRKEFPDAYFVEKIRKIIRSNRKDKYILVSSDNGVKESLKNEDNLIIIDDIKQLLTMLSNVGEKVRNEIELYLEKDDLEKVLDSIILSANLQYDEDEYLEFDIDYLQIDTMQSIDIVNYDSENDEYIVCSDFTFKVCGNFIKRNLDVSVYNKHTCEYTYEEYDNICGINIPSVYVEIKIKKTNNEYIFSGINHCDDLRINDAYSYDYIERNVSPSRLDNLIAVWN